MVKYYCREKQKGFALADINPSLNPSLLPQTLSVWRNPKLNLTRANSFRFSIPRGESETWDVSKAGEVYAPEKKS